MTYDTKPYDFQRLDVWQIPWAVELPNDPFPDKRENGGAYSVQEAVTNPVASAQNLFKALNYYLTTDDHYALELGQAIGKSLLASVIEVEDAFYFPYSEPFRLHGRDELLMEVPWFSGMAQGQVLGAFVRLYTFTEDSMWREAADKVFASFVPINEFSRPWTTTVSHHNTLWFEEYPFDPPCAALNGHLFAAFGLYEYWDLTSSEVALALLRGGFYTVEKLGQTFRVPGSLSLYCLGHGVFSSRYHDVHMAQLLSMYAMTQDPVFAHLHDDFYEDSAPTLIAASLTIPVGPIEIVTAGSNGQFSSREFREFLEPVIVSVDRRIQILGTGSYGYRISSSDPRYSEFEGNLIVERNDVMVDGLLSRNRSPYGPLFGTVSVYNPPRMAVFLTTPNEAYKDDEFDFGEPVTVTDSDFSEPIPVLAVAIANGSAIWLVNTPGGNIWVSAVPRFSDRVTVYPWVPPVSDTTPVAGA